MNTDETEMRAALRASLVAAFIATHSVTIPRFRRDSFRPALRAVHPLYGPLTEGITDGVTAWMLTLDGRLVHVAHGQLTIAHEPYHGPRRSRNASQTNKPTTRSPKQPKLDTTDLY